MSRKRRSFNDVIVSEGGASSEVSSSFDDLIHEGCSRRDVMHAALLYQGLRGLEPTAVLDDATRASMCAKRCGERDDILVEIEEMKMVGDMTLEQRLQSALEREQGADASIDGDAITLGRRRRRRRDVAAGDDASTKHVSSQTKASPSDASRDVKAQERTVTSDDEALLEIELDPLESTSRRFAPDRSACRS